MPASVYTGNVPSGTTISVYSADGSTLLYSYKVNASNGPTPVGSDESLNTGYTPFKQGPVYIGYSGNGGSGSTNFDYA